MFSLFRLRYLSSLALATLGAIGCSQNLEQNPAFQEQVTRLNRVDEDQKAASRQLSSLDADFQQVSRDVAKLSGKAPGGSPDAIKALEQRIALLEKRVAEGGVKPNTASNPAPNAAAPKPAAPEEAGEAVDNAPPKAPGAPAQAAGATKPVAKRMTVIGKTAPSATKTRKNLEKRDSVARGSAARSPRRAPSGTYHLVKLGDTLEKIAAQYNASASAIMEANHLPVTATLAPGQTIYVPRAAK